MPGSTNEAGNAVVGANGTDQRALVLLDALGARLVEAIKAGVNATSDGLGVLAEETDRLVGLEMAGVCESLVLLLLAEGFQRPLFYDLGLALALLSFGGGLVFARFLERWP